MPALSKARPTQKVRDIITKSLRKLGAIGAGETPEAVELSEALDELNAMLDDWNTERLMVYAVNREVFPLTPGKQLYTVGPGGDWDTVRPPKIEYVLWQNSLADPVAEYPVEMLEDKEWAQIPVKGSLGDRPLQVFYEPNMPLGEFNVWPVPAGATNVVLGTWTQFTAFADVNEEIVLPPAYETAIVYHLAIRLAPDYEREASATVVQIAKTAKGKLKRLNMPKATLTCDNALAPGRRGRAYDIRVNN